jgi:hypothetical protein
VLFIGLGTDAIIKKISLRIFVFILARNQDARPLASCSARARDDMDFETECFGRIPKDLWLQVSALSLVFDKSVGDWLKRTQGAARQRLGVATTIIGTRCTDNKFVCRIEPGTTMLPPEAHHVRDEGQLRDLVRARAAPARAAPATARKRSARGAADPPTRNISPPPSPNGAAAAAASGSGRGGGGGAPRACVMSQHASSGIVF